MLKDLKSNYILYRDVKNMEERLLVFLKLRCLLKRT